jgi:hypothetical protein
VEILRELLPHLNHHITKSGGTAMQNELERYKNFDPTNAPLVKPNFVKKLQERHAIAQAKAFDADVVTWLSSQDDETKQHINDMVRHIMALKRA